MRVTDEAARVFAEHAGITLEEAAGEIARLLGAMPRRPPRTPPRGHYRYRYRNQIEGVDFVARIDDSRDELVVLGLVLRGFWRAT